MSAFNGDVLCDLAAQFLTLAEKQGATIPLMIGHRLMGRSLVSHRKCRGKVGRISIRAIALYDPAEHLPLATRFGQDVRVAVLSYRSWTLWLLGYPEAALADANNAIKDAREIGHAATLMYALFRTIVNHLLCGNYAAAEPARQELIALGDEKGASFWKTAGELQSKVAYWPRPAKPRMQFR